MRTHVENAAGISVRAIAGIHTVLLAFDISPEARNGLLGFAIKREEGNKEGYWLRGQKVFPSVVPNPVAGQKYSTLDQPIQSLLWGDYTAKPGSDYRFTIRPVYGKPKKLDYGADITLNVSTEVEFGEKHGVWFNRGAIASQAYAERYQNKEPPHPDDPNDPQTNWLSRGLLAACLKFIDETPAGDALRVAAYEFTYQPVLKAFKDAIKRGVDVLIVYEAGQEKVKGKLAETDATKGAANAIKLAKFPAANLIKRTLRKAIPHNKFIVRLEGGHTARSVWTGSTNFTISGFIGQANVGHQVNDDAVADSYLKYWTILSKDPAPDDAEQQLAELTPDPEEVLDKGTTTFFSPRRTAGMLDWYVRRIDEAKEAVLFTGAFGVNEKLAVAFARDKDFLRYIMLEKPPSRKTKALLGKDRDLIIVPGQVLGQVWTANEKGELTLRRPVPGFELEKWFLHEEHYRKKGNIFFVHLKNLIIDPLSDDPIVLTGSANFSDGSLRDNDENMLLIRGDTRVADIYMTEFDRLVRHFYFRDMAADLSGDGTGGEAIFLKEDGSWLASYFKDGNFKDRRRRMFFP